VRSDEMLGAQGSAHDPEAIRVIFLLITAWAVVCWRTAIKLIVIAAVLLTVVGALTIAQGLH